MCNLRWTSATAQDNLNSLLSATLRFLKYVSVFSNKKGPKVFKNKPRMENQTNYSNKRSV